MEGRELPVGWERCLLGDAVDYGRTQKAEPSDIPDHAWVLELEDIEKDSSKLLSRSTFADRKSKSTKNAFDKGAVLYGKLRPYLNKVLLADEPGFCSTEIIPLQAGEGIAAGYLFHWLKSPEFLEYTDEVSHGINMPRLGTEAGRKAPLVLAPLNEQRRIAAKLDTTLAAVDACRQRLDGVAAILKRFRQAVLAAATSGELTREWREERGKSMDDWSERTVGDIVTDIEAGLNVQCEERPPMENERGLVKISAVTWGIYDEDQSKTLKSDQQVLERNRIRSGDFLISRANTIELVGSCVIVHEAKRALYLSDKVLRLVMPDEWKKWLLMCLRADNGRRQIEGLSSGNQLSMRNLSQKSLLSIKVLLPPMEELCQVEVFSDRLLAMAAQLEARLISAQKIIDRLTPALLAKAFRGELVPQDPNDEPASVLLERIWVARQEGIASGKPTRRRRRNVQASITTSTVLTNMLTRNDVQPNHLSAILKESGPLSAEVLWSASQLEIDDFYAQLRDEEALGFLYENKGDAPHSLRLLEPLA